MKTRIPELLIILMSFLIAVPVSAAPVGFLIVEEGIIKLRRDRMDQIVRVSNRRVPVEAKDEIQTGPKTRVKIMLRSEKETVRLYSNTFFTVKGVSEEKSEVFLPIGKIRCLINPTFQKMKKIRRRFQVRTITAVIGVKGTDFVVQSDGVSTNLLTIEGVTSLANAKRPDVEVEVGANQASRTTTEDAPPPPAVDVPQEAVDQVTTQDTEETWESVPLPEQPEPEEQAPPEDDPGEEEGEPEEEAPGEVEEPEEELEIQTIFIDETEEAKETAEDQGGFQEAAEQSINFTIQEN